MHFASPASPIDFERIPIQILKVGGLGTHNCLGLAKAKGARFFLASTSEVYGDPQVHPQPETYWGNVNPIGPRGVYDEAKRFAEAMTMAYHRHHGVDVRIVRIFNTYGAVHARRRRAVGVATSSCRRCAASRSRSSATAARPASFCYVDDEVRGFLALLDADVTGPINIGNPNEFTIRAARRAGHRGHRLVVDDHRTSRCRSTTRRSASPTSRWPASTSAGSRSIPLRTGLERTAEYFRAALARWTKDPSCPPYRSYLNDRYCRSGTRLGAGRVRPRPRRRRR